jgi:glucokinase
MGVDEIETSRISAFQNLMQWTQETSVLAGFDDIECLAIAVPGAVENGTFSQPLNMPWHIDLGDAGSFVENTYTLLMNDFVAQALATETLAGKQARAILVGCGALGATVAVVGVGTGFGKAAVVYPTRGAPIVVPSEGGQANFAPETEEEFEFIRFMCARHKRNYLIWDMVLSGGGLSDLHSFMTGLDLEPSIIMAESSGETDTIKTFSRFLGRACRNYVLETFAIGGLFLTGGVLQKNPSIVTHPAFREAFHNGVRRNATLLSETPVRLIVDPSSGLRGAALAGATALDDRAGR